MPKKQAGIDADDGGKFTADIGMAHDKNSGPLPPRRGNYLHKETKLTKASKQPQIKHLKSRQRGARFASIMAPNSSPSGVSWLVFALLTVVSWGVYGAFLHTGQSGMSTSPGADPSIARYKAFLFVGVAYFLTAVLAPLFLLMLKGAAWSDYSAKGVAWSLVAGIVGAVGAFGVLLAFGAGGKPGVVMSIVFAGAPVVNAVYTLWQHPPAGGLGTIKPQFFLGIILAALGGFLVTWFKPAPTAPAKPRPEAEIQASASKTRGS